MMQRNKAQVVKKTDVYLTPSQRSVLELLCLGKTNSEIAQALHKKDISSDIKKLYQITKLKTRTALVRWAFETGYVYPMS